MRLAALRPSEEGARGVREDISRRRRSPWNHFIQRISRSEAAGFYFGEEQANPRTNEKSSSPQQPGTREQQQDRQVHQLPHAPRTSRP